MSEDCYGYILRCAKCGESWIIDREFLTTTACPRCRSRAETEGRALTSEEYEVRVVTQVECDRQIGRKDDDGKIRLDLIPPLAFRALGAVLTFGAKKYGPDSWQHVENGIERYYAALMRHLLAWREGERDDPESGHPHLWHAFCSLLFILWLSRSKKEETGQA